MGEATGEIFHADRQSAALAVLEVLHYPGLDVPDVKKPKVRCPRPYP